MADFSLGGLCVQPDDQGHVAGSQPTDPPEPGAVAAELKSGVFVYRAGLPLPGPALRLSTIGQFAIAATATAGPDALVRLYEDEIPAHESPEAIPADDFKAILGGTNTAAGGCMAGCGSNGCGKGQQKGNGPCANAPANDDRKAPGPKARRKAGQR